MHGGIYTETICMEGYGDGHGITSCYPVRGQKRWSQWEVGGKQTDRGSGNNDRGHGLRHGDRNHSATSRRLRSVTH